MIITDEQIEELRDLLDRHGQESDCQRTGECCAALLIEFLEELLSDV